MINREYIKQQFKLYTDKYDSNDSKIALKISHTYRVADLCETIAKSLNLSGEDVDICWMAGMLHDIGRFEQIKRYGTFIDGQSVDHAAFGADLLFNEGLYETVTGLTCEYRELTEKVIRAHNMFRLPSDLNEREAMLANILRDADKIDILKVNCETKREEIYNVSTAVLKNASVSDDVKDAFDKKSCAIRRNDNTAIDHLVGHICFIFELVYPKSISLMLEQGYIYELLKFESDNPDTIEWFKHMNEAISEYACLS